MSDISPHFTSKTSSNKNCQNDETPHTEFRMNTVFGVPVINILWTIVAGKRFQSDDPTVQRMMDLLNRLFRCCPSVLCTMNLLTFPFQTVQRQVCVGVSAACLGPHLLLRARAGRQAEDHHGAAGDVQGLHQGAQGEPGHQPAQVVSTVIHHRKISPLTRDFIDVYLMEMMKGTNPQFDQECLEITCLDLFKAGAETSSTTLLWIVLYLVRYQEVQERCYQEVLSVTGEERPALKHLASLPYCQAVICEVQRLACVAPQTIPHR